MSALKVKICGLTRREDVLFAAHLGASALGFVFASGPRFVSPATVAAITQGIPRTIDRFAVFVNAPVEEIAAAVATSRVNGVQLHGAESPGFVRRLRDRFPHFKIIKALEPRNFSEEAAYDCDAILLDPSRHNRRPIEERDAPGARLSRPFFIAGGIGSANLRKLVRAFQPPGVDISSAVESSPGIKDPEKLETLFAVVGEVDL